jgi:hypothetical protein
MASTPWLHRALDGEEKLAACSFGWWLVLICAERKVLVAGLF